jgi:hypothetical protein
VFLYLNRPFIAKISLTLAKVGGGDQIGQTTLVVALKLGALF